MTAPREPALPFFLPIGSREIFCLHHAADPPVRGAVVYVPPFAEEMNKARRMAALTARALAVAGWHVLQPDLTGTGDSAGDFADAAWDVWLDDIAGARAWLLQRTAQDPWLWGLRLGALLATTSLARAPAPGLVVWQPVLSGRSHLQQFLRLAAGAEWLAASRQAAAQTASIERLRAGHDLEVAGYTITPALASPMAAAELALPAASTPLGWFEISPRPDATLAPASRRLLDARLGAAGTLVEVVQGPSFWQSAETETAPALIPATCAAFSG